MSFGHAGHAEQPRGVDDDIVRAYLRGASDRDDPLAFDYDIAGKRSRSCATEQGCMSDHCAGHVVPSLFRRD
ncbi:hypothetical protein ACFSHP_13965 [Novosphingobium panipatense]